LAVGKLGRDPVALAAAAAVAVAFFVAGRRVTALVLVLSALAGYGLTQGVKSYVHRPRPDVAWALEPIPDSPSFPSGSAVNAMACYVAAALLAARRLRGRFGRVALVGAAGVLALAIGASKLYAGVHFLTDVVGGWAAGLACALLALWADRCCAAPTVQRSDPARGPFVVGA
jgi:undecaprenyl-diphosphatase